MVTENGGLDSKSFSIAGEALLTNKAEECKNSFDTILESCTILKTKILDSATNHRQEELTKFISCIEKRIDDLEVLNNNVTKKYEITDTGLKEVGSTTINTPGLEGIQIDNEGNLSAVFENFKDTNNPNQTLHLNVNTTDFSKTLNETKLDLEQIYKEKGNYNQNKLN